jgi:tetratricopeptide (TPR) repeat protein
MVDQKSGRFAEARSWYEKAREMALRLMDHPTLCSVTHNLGLVMKEVGMASAREGDEPAAREHFEAARQFVEECLRIARSQKNQRIEADSLGELALVHILLKDLETAERHANAALNLHESLGLKEVLNDYGNLLIIARVRGDIRAAAEWAQKRDDLRAELNRRAGSGGGLSTQVLKGLQQLALVCAQTGFGDSSLDLRVEEALAKLDKSPSPFPDFAAYLRQLAGRLLPPIPASLPAELRQILEQMEQEIREARGGGKL